MLALAWPSTSRETVTFGAFEANLRTRELLNAGAKVRLPDQSFQVLAILLERQGELVTREEIHKRLWPQDTFVDFDHGLNNAVNRLREALGDSAEAPRFIETLPRRGYRFIVSPGSRPAASQVERRQDQTGRVEIREIAPEVVPAIKVKPRQRWWLYLALCVTAAVILLVVFEKSRTQIAPSSRTFILPPEGARFDLVGDDGGSVALGPDGSKLAFVALDKEGKAQVWLRRLERLTAEPLEGTEGATFPFWSPDGNAVGFFAGGKLKKIDLATGQVVSLCRAPFGRGGSWSHGVIVFTPDSHSAIYKVSDSGGAPVAVTIVDTSKHTTHRWPKFLPDGQHFLYLAASHQRYAHDNAVYLASMSGKQNQLVVASDADATYASGYLFFLQKNSLVAQAFDLDSGQLRGEIRPTVERVLYDPSIWKVVLDVSENGVMAYQLGEKVTGTRMKLWDRSGREVALIDDSGYETEVHLSPDGRKIITGRSAMRGGGGYSDLWVYDLASGGRTQITFNKYDNGSAIWSRDGARVLFAGKRQHYNVYEVNAAGTGQEHLILETGSDTWPLDLSPDGRFLLYGQGLNIGRTESQLWIYDMKGQVPPSPLLGSHAVEGDGQFSPDGRWVAYTSNESGTEQVYVVPFQRLSASSAGKADIGGRRQISVSGGRWPRWRRDGRELFYVSPDSSLVAVPVKIRGSQCETGAVRSLFRIDQPHDTFPYDVAPDGRRFILNTPAPEGNAPLTLVENGLSDFKR